MVQLQLYIEGQEVEMFKDESFTLTQSIQDIRDISKIFTDFSRTFNVPASKTNNKLFKHFYNFNILGFDARKKKNATLLMNYKPFKEGTIKLEGVKLKNNEPETYKLTFYGNLVNLKDVLGEDLLSGLVNLKYFNFDYTDANIKTYLTNGSDVEFFGETIVDAIIFPLITSSLRLISDDSLANTDTVINVHSGSSSANVGLPLNQLKPALRIYTIIRAIEIQYPELTFDRSFFDPSNTVFYDLYMWLHNKEGLLFQDQDAQYPITGLTPVEGGISEIQGFKGASFKNSFNEQNAKRELRIFVDPSADGPYNLVIKKDGEEFQKFDNLSGNTINGKASDKGNIELPNGTYTFYIETTTVSTYTVDIRITHNPNDILKGKRTVLFRGSAEFAADSVVNVPSIMPEMKVIDFLTGLFKTFNLTAFQNLDGIIEVKTLDNYFSESTKVWDITKDLDKTKSSVDITIPYKEIEFKYEDTNSFLAKNHLELAGKPWGSLAFKDGDKFDGQKYTVNLPFDHMKFERLYQTNNGVIKTTTDASGNTIKQNTSLQYGYSVNETQSPYLGKPILFYATPSLLTSIKVKGLDGTTISIVTNVYIPLNSQKQIIVGQEGQSLNFNTEIDEYSRQPVSKTLFENFYKKYVKDMMDVRKRISTFKAFLPMQMLYNLSLADKIIVFDDIYRINKLTTDFSTNESTLELTNIFEEIKYNTLISIAGTGITIDTNTIFADTINFFADSSLSNSGFNIPGITTLVPSDIPSNNPQPILEDEIVSVTPPKIESVAIESNINTEVYLKFKVSELGKLINTPQIEQYGFLYSTTKSDLDDTDVDNLIAKSGVTNIPFVTTPQNKFELPNTASASVSGLSHPASIFFKFYGRTNINSLFPKADVLSSVVETKTVDSASEILSVLLVSTFTEFQTTPAKGCGTQFTLNNGEQFIFEHTGGARNPQVGDLIRTKGVMRNGLDNQTWSFSTFDGGVKSLVGMNWPNYANYLNAYVLDKNGFSKMGIRVNMWTAVIEVVEACP